MGFTVYTIVTGGANAPTRVLQYDMGGAVGSLPDLNEGRRAHACGYFYDEDRRVVLIATDGYNSEYLTSIEISIEGANNGLLVMLFLLQGMGYEVSQLPIMAISLSCFICHMYSLSTNSDNNNQSTTNQFINSILMSI